VPRTADAPDSATRRPALTLAPRRGELGGVESTLLPVSPALGVAMAMLVLVAAGASGLGALGLERAIVAAALRAVLQLAAVSLVLAVIVRIGWLTVVFVGVMYVAASATAGRRMTRGRSAGWAAVPIVASTLPVITGMLLTGVLPSQALAVIPVSGILIGGAMTASTLAGRRALDDLSTRRGEVEAALSIGLPARDAALEICRPAASNAMIPILDQTRTVGLVTLPGAFVGMLLGGASPIEAGAVQLFVLVALLAVQASAVVLVAEAVARGVIRRQN
jgi:putative ABC transport system permease protein